MGYSVFDTDASVFFVGGRGDKSGRTALAGGCTQGWWDSGCPDGTNAQKAAAMGKLMGTDGGPVVDEAGCVFTTSDKRISKADAFAGIEAGMVAYVVETPVAGVNIATGRYRITAVDAGGGWIEIGGATGVDATVKVTVGGAFDSLQNALDATNAVVHNVTIFTNLDETLSASIDVDTGGGAVLQNSFKKVVGYKVVPGDISYGGGSYQSALSILKAGSVEGDSCVTLDADGGSFEVLKVSVSNVVFENVQICNTASGKVAVAFIGTPSNVVFRECRFVDVEGVYWSQGHSVLVERCYSHVRNHHFICYGAGNVIVDSVGKLGSVVKSVYACATGTSGAASVVVMGCVCDGSAAPEGAALRVVGPPCNLIATGNTFYGFRGEGVRLNSGSMVLAYDNIFALSPGAYGIYCRTWSTGAGSLVEGNNCWWVTDGSSLPFVRNEANISEPPVMSETSIEADPEFADAGSFDFRVRNAKLLRGGRGDAEGNTGQIGAVVQAYEFARRSRMMNPARLGVVR